MIKSRPSFQILNFPLWVLLAFWLIARRKPAADANDLAAQLSLLQELYYSLPLPRNWFERVLVTRIIEWIHSVEGPAIESYWNYELINA